MGNLRTKKVMRTISIPEDRVAEARRDLVMLTNPANLITFNDGYYAKSLVEKWGMPISDLQELVGKLRNTKRRTK